MHKDILTDSTTKKITAKVRTTFVSSLYSPFSCNVAYVQSYNTYFSLSNEAKTI